MYDFCVDVISYMKLFLDFIYLVLILQYQSKYVFCDFSILINKDWFLIRLMYSLNNLNLMCNG